MNKRENERHQTIQPPTVSIRFSKKIESFFFLEEYCVSFEWQWLQNARHNHAQNNQVIKVKRHTVRRPRLKFHIPFVLTSLPLSCCTHITLISLAINSKYLISAHGFCYTNLFHCLLNVFSFVLKTTSNIPRKSMVQLTYDWFNYCITAIVNS